MKGYKQTFIFGFALFAGFFGAGNLILPPMLGFNSGPQWWLVAIGFIITATAIPLLSLFGHAKLQGNMLDFGNKVSPLFSLIYSLTVYLIIVTLPCPRTAAVTHEMAIAPYFGTSPLLTSCIYFVMVFIFVMNRSKALEILGKYLTPIIVGIVFAIIGIGLFAAPQIMNPSQVNNAIVEGLLEGYQTYDAIAGMVMGGVVVISLNAMGATSYKEKKKIIARSGLIAMLGLFLIYTGLISVGAYYNAEFESSISRIELLQGLSNKTLGDIGTLFISVLMALACFTTAVAIVVSIADFFKALFNNSKKVYIVTTIISCLIGVYIGSYDVGFIIDIALPALMFIYPISVVLILLNVIPERFASQNVFRVVVLTAFLFSIPDFLKYFVPAENIKPVIEFIPLAQNSLGWLLPSLAVFIMMNLMNFKKHN